MILTAILFFVLGIIVKHGRMHFLIAGYNMMSDKRKAEYDIEGIATIFRNTFIGMALLILLGYLLSGWLEYSELESIAFYGSLLIGIPYLLFKTNSRRYRVKDQP